MNSFNPFVYQKINEADIKSPNIPSSLSEQYAQCGEDLIVLSIAASLQRLGLVANWNDHVVIEVGANHAFGGSNSYLLEKRYGTRSLLVEANPELIPDLRTARPSAEIINVAICDDDRESVTLYCSNHNELSSLDRGFVDDWHGGRVGVGKALEVPALRMNRFFEQHLSKEQKILLLSIDIEGQDLAIVQDTDFTTFHPVMVMLEPSEHYHPGEGDRMIATMTSHGYCLIAQTDVNLVFIDAVMLAQLAATARASASGKDDLRDEPTGLQRGPDQPETVDDDDIRKGMRRANKSLATWQLDEAFIENALQLVADKDVLSLDVFDTAVTRCFSSPADVFAEVERRLRPQHGHAVDGLAAAREQAEINARRRQHQLHHVEEVTFQEIYRELPALLPTFKDWERVAALELEVEREALVAVPDILELVRRVRASGKSCVFVSDMYLPQEFIASVLRDTGYKEWNDIYVSSDYRVTKASGRIWETVGEKYPLKGIVHIGDNEHSDVTAPRQHGITTLAYRRVPSEHRFGVPLTSGAAAYSLWQRHVELQAAQSLATRSECDEWYQLGRGLGGILLSTFVTWLAERVRLHGIDRLYFFARDGYLMQSAWEASGLGEALPVEQHYLYISRASLNLANAARECTPQRLNAATLTFLSSSIGHTRLSVALDRAGLAGIEPLVCDVIDTFGSLDTKLATAEDIQRFQVILRKHSAPIHAVLREKYEACEHYLKQEGLAAGGHYGIVDMGWHGSLQRSLVGLLASFAPGIRAPVGFYYGLWPQVAKNRYLAGPMEACFANSFLSERFQSELHQGVALLEELHSAPHGTTLGYRVDAGVAHPVLQHTSIAQADNDRRAGWFQEGALAGVRELFGRSPTSSPVRVQDLSIDSARAALGSVFVSPTASDLALFSSIGHCATFDHSSLTPMVSPDLPASLDEMRRLLATNEWAAGQLKQWWLHGNTSSREMVRALAPEMFPHFGARALRQFA